MEIAKVCAAIKPRALIGVGGSAGESPIESLCTIAATEHDVILISYPLSGATGLALGLMPWLISGGALLQHQPFDYNGFVRQLLDGRATVTALPPSILAALERDGVLRDPSCTFRRVGCVWSMAHFADPVPEFDTTATPLFDLYPLGDLASLVRPRRRSTSPRVASARRDLRDRRRWRRRPVPGDEAWRRP
jgi:hypothetical protein